MRILQVHNYYQIPGGEDQVVRNEGKLLKEHGHDVFLYSRRNDEIKRMNLMEKLCLPFTACFSLRTYREVRKIILEKKIDVVHVHNTLPLISPSVFYAAFFTHKPVVMTVHNFRLLCPGGVCYRGGKTCEACVKKGLWQSVRYGCYRGSKIQTLICACSMQLHRMLKTYAKISYICLTGFNKEKLLQMKQIPKEQVYVKPNFVSGLGEIVPMDGRENAIIYAGRLEESKGIKVLLRAYKYLQKEAVSDPEVIIPDLLVYGDGSLRKQCEKYVKKHGLTKVSFKGNVSNEMIRESMAGSKAIVIPTLLQEGFPMNVAEGYAVRTPILGSDIGNVGELVVDGVNGWKFKTGDYVDLAEKIMSLNKPDAKKCTFQMVENKAWTAEENYSLLMDIYERCK